METIVFSETDIIVTSTHTPGDFGEDDTGMGG